MRLTDEQLRDIATRARAHERSTQMHRQAFIGEDVPTFTFDSVNVRGTLKHVPSPADQFALYIRGLRIFPSTGDVKLRGRRFYLTRGEPRGPIIAAYPYDPRAVQEDLNLTTMIAAPRPRRRWRQRIRTPARPVVMRPLLG